MMILVALSFVATALDLIKENEAGGPIKNVQIVANLITMVLIIVYAFCGYKKPHGNSLRTVSLIFAALVVARPILPHNMIENDALRYIADGGAGLAAILIAYISGRLNKIEKNKTLMIFVGILLSASAVVVITSFPDFNIMRCISNLTQLICWVALCLAYTTRFEKHKVAGLEEK